MTYYLAVDIGASSGRHILGSIQNGKLVLEEIHRFENLPAKQGNSLVWDIERLFKEIVDGIKKCKAQNKIPVSMGIDTWGVDYVLLDKNSEPIMPAYSYRDLRTEKYLNTVVPFEEMYKICGIQKQPFNTVYQLLADKDAGRLENAEDFLLLPDFFSFLLTGVKAKEYTNASTTGLLDAKSRDWAYGLIKELGLPEKIFKKPVDPGFALGGFTEKIKNEVGFDCKVILPATHDTASAVAAVPEEGALYISSGTWSLLGIEGEANLTSEAREAGYTNEGSADGKIRFLKNIMGLWLIQQARHDINDKYSFAQMAQMAQNEAVYDWHINVNDEAFFSPENMTETVKSQCIKEGQPVPKTVGELAHCIYNSLAYLYRDAIKALEKMTGKRYEKLCIVGGGSKNEYLNILTAKHTGLSVFAGPDEATAAGNLVVQLLAEEKNISKENIRELIKKSFNIKEIKPNV